MDIKRLRIFSGWKGIAAVYLLLLLLSHLFTGSSYQEQESRITNKAVLIDEVSGDSLLNNRQVKVAYLDKYKGDRENPPVVLMLHGSPVGLEMFESLIPKLSESYRIIAPEFPGYGASGRKVPDYSMRAYAFYVSQLLEKLDIEKAHLVGYSMGGGVAMNLSHYYPDQVKSIGLLSATGVQELELLGSYTLNHAVHGVQLSLIWLLYNAVPHFGLLNELPVNVPYARNFYDSDQRPIREYLHHYKKPMLIQHGLEDRLIPVAAAREHHRIVPQSKLIEYNGGHGIVLSKSEKIAEDIIGFIHNVETGKALTYSEASQNRIQAAKRSFDSTDFARFEGLALLLIMALIAFSTLISEDLTCIGAGLLAARGLIGFWPATLACFIGILFGDMMLYLAGRWMGKSAINKAPFKWIISEKDLQSSSQWFKAKGPAIIIASRFLPGSRLPTYFSAGVLGAGFWMFSLYFMAAAILWTPLLVGISMFIGTELIYYFSVYSEYAIWVFLAAIFLLVFIAKVIIPAFNYKGRRLLLAKVKRLKNWEFWSPYIIYFPVCCYIVFLWFKYKSLTVFTAANPAIQEGGFIGESKAEILDLFDSEGVPVAKYIFIDSKWPHKRKIETATDFIRNNSLGFPIVVKPNEGQRGAGVVIAKSHEQFIKAIQDATYDLIVQEFIDGEEYGIFYYRYPDQVEGDIFSVTTKKMLTITGDGERTLEELILDHPRALCLAEKHLRYHEDDLYSIPENGDRVPLVELGTHARGAIFGDGKHLITKELKQEMDRISKMATGFYFGRFDIRCPSNEHLKTASSLKIIEVNGVTSESTNIYDKSNSFYDAQRILRKQWEIAFEIGKRNAESGETYSSISALIKKIADYEPKQ